MTNRRKFLIDTDTASDDAVALLMALRDPGVEVLAVTVVAGSTRWSWQAPPLPCTRAAPVR
jgi:inosine-uridine nucleoside N-ribohydrolase